MVLSLSTTMRFCFRMPTKFSPSKVSPLESDPSPMTATTRFLPSALASVSQMPLAAGRALPVCPDTKGSYGLSAGLTKGHRPPCLRSVPNRSFLPVRILWVYAWWPTSQRILSLGALKT